MTFNELIENFGKTCGAELSATDGAVALEIDGMSVTVQEVPERDALVVVGDVGEPPPEGLEALMTAMLEANYMFLGTGGGALARDPETGRFHLCRLASLASLDDAGFAALMETFSNVLETWRKMLADYRPAVAADASAASGDSASPFGAFMQV